ncbi:hypothetical protein [Streptomyces sp. KLOTTS4A1]|uniref:hypothetical protein n=1 Tax=Streptomyces sp. KLOTTS4A1 TaxID=3390996 RepID=UPI0039F5D540
MWLVAALVGVLVGLVPSALLVLTFRQLRTEQERMLGAEANVVESAIEPVNPVEHGYLAGGPERAAQVVLTDLFLSGRIEGTEGGLRRVADADAVALAEDAASGVLHRRVLGLLADDRTMEVRRLAIAAVSGSTDGEADMARMARHLRERGLCREHAVVERARRHALTAKRRNDRIAAVLAGLGATAGIVLAVFTSAELAAFVAAVPITSAVSYSFLAARAEDRLAELTPRTPAGDAAVEAGATVPLEAITDDEDRRKALRLVAGRGFSGLAGSRRSEEGRRTEQAGGIRPSESGYGRPSADAFAFAGWCVVRNMLERSGGDEGGNPVLSERPPSQELWDNYRKFNGSKGNWALTLIPASGRGGGIVVDR